MFCSAPSHQVNITKRLSDLNNYIEELSAKQVNGDAREEEQETSHGHSRVTFSGSWANDKAVDLQWASSMETKRYPIVVFNSNILREAQSNPAGSRYHLTFRLVNAEARIISQIFLANGFQEVGSCNQDFNIMWTSSNPNPNLFKSLLPHQRVNHFPRSYELTRKDRMYKNIERLQQAKGLKHFNFLPKTFILPTEFTEFTAVFNKIKGSWIVKPVASSRGRGIYLIKSPNQVALDEPLIVSKYVENPLLINGHKSDLRLYVLVTSYDPLVIYLYEEGLARFATVPYDESGSNLWNPCMHLCNSSINKYHSDYTTGSSAKDDDQGHKWSLSAFLKHLRANNLNTTQLMASIEDVIIKSIISVEFSVNSACKMFVPHRNNCFELYGFDILVDSNLKPWLLEVNMSPSLNTESPIDMKIKSSLLCDLFTLVGVPAVDPVLRRAQFDQHLREMTASQRAHRSPEERRQSAIKLSSSLGTSLGEVTRIVRDVEEQQERRRGWVRIFPTEATWALYGSLLDFSSSTNLSLQEHLYPQTVIRPLSKTRRLRDKAGNKQKSLEETHFDQYEMAERIAQYEKPLNVEEAELYKRRKYKDNHSLEMSVRYRDKVLKMLENGQQMNEKQARIAFTIYLKIVLKKLSEFNDQIQDKNNLDLVLKFLLKASLNLKDSYFVKKPSSKLVGKDRAAVIGKHLGDFIERYKKETEMMGEERTEQHLPEKIFQQFLGCASESDLEAVLTFQSKIQGCTHIFSGKCVTTTNNKKMPLLKITNNSCQDRRLRTSRCFTNPQPRATSSTASSLSSSSSCLDIST